MKHFKPPRKSLKQLSEELQNIRTLLTENENILLELRLQGRTDSSAARLLDIPIDTIAKRRRALQDRIAALVWWRDNKIETLNVIGRVWGYSGMRIFELVTMRATQREIMSYGPKGWTYWKVNHIIKDILTRFGQEKDREGFRTFMEKMKLGYKLPWKSTKA